MTWRVPRAWEGETAVILAGGPSLREFDTEIFRQLSPRPRVIAINDSWRIWPDADVCYFCDAAWFCDQERKNRAAIDGLTRFYEMTRWGFWVKGGEEPGGPRLPHDVHVLRFTGQRGYDPDPGSLRHGSNSGYQAIHLAAHYGAARILLLGYDMHVQTGRTHWHGEDRPRDFGNIIRHSFLPHFPTLVEPLRLRGIEVLNCTPGSALTCWPMAKLEDALAGELKGV